MKRIKCRTWCGILMVLIIAATAYALDQYLIDFNNQYGTAGTVLNTCVLCHPAGGGNTAGNLNNYARDYAAAGHSFTAIESLDSDGDGFTNIVEINARTFPGDPNSFPVVVDTVAPTVTAFVIPATASSLTVTITTFTATDNVAVTGYLVTETAATPAAGAAGWSATPPGSHTFATEGSKTLYAWAKDAAGNVSTSLSDSVVITLPVGADAIAPTVTAFVIPATSSYLNVPIATFTATDNVAVTGYLVTETDAAPAAGAAGWSATAPGSYTFTTEGSKTLYAWAKDAAGNVSASLSASVVITLTAPVADEGGNSGCFIATAAFGSPLNPYVKILKEFRDTFLMTSAGGRKFVNLYYRVSPEIAGQVSANPFLRAIVLAILLPVIGFSSLALKVDLVPAVMLSAFLLGSILFFGRWCFKRRRRI